MELPMGLLMHGYYLGRESRYYEDNKRTVMYLSIACGVDSYRVSIKSESIRTLDALKQFDEIVVKCRAAVTGNGRMYYCDGELVL